MKHNEKGFWENYLPNYWNLILFKTLTYKTTAEKSETALFLVLFYIWFNLEKLYFPVSQSSRA